MDGYIAPLLLFVVLFVGFGLAQRGKKSSGGCSGCTGTDCSDKPGCSKEEQSGHQ